MSSALPSHSLDASLLKHHIALLEKHLEVSSSEDITPLLTSPFIPIDSQDDTTNTTLHNYLLSCSNGVIGDMEIDEEEDDAGHEPSDSAGHAINANDWYLDWEATATRRLKALISLSGIHLSSVLSSMVPYSHSDDGQARRLEVTGVVSDSDIPLDAGISFSLTIDSIVLVEERGDASVGESGGQRPRLKRGRPSHTAGQERVGIPKVSDTVSGTVSGIPKVFDTDPIEIIPLSSPTTQSSLPSPPPTIHDLISNTTRIVSLTITLPLSAMTEVGPFISLVQKSRNLLAAMAGLAAYARCVAKRRDVYHRLKQRFGDWITFPNGPGGAVMIVASPSSTSSSTSSFSFLIHWSVAVPEWDLLGDTGFLDTKVQLIPKTSSTFLSSVTSDGSTGTSLLAITPEMWERLMQLKGVEGALNVMCSLLNRAYSIV